MAAQTGLDKLKEELAKCIEMEQVKREDITVLVNGFQAEPNLKIAYELRSCISGWIRTVEKHEFLSKIFHQDWGQEDTKHE